MVHAGVIRPTERDDPRVRVLGLTLLSAGAGYCLAGDDIGKGSEMLIKAIEIRDKGTFVPAIAIKLIPDDEGQRYLLRRAGYGFGRLSVVLMNLNDCRAQNDPSDWGGRTWRVAHEFVERHWDRLTNGDVVDVEFILGETCIPRGRVDRSL
jgi:hypothetical protein